MLRCQTSQNEKKTEVYFSIQGEPGWIVNKFFDQTVLGFFSNNSTWLFLFLISIESDSKQNGLIVCVMLYRLTMYRQTVKQQF